MAECTNGSEPKPGSPEWDMFDNAFLAGSIGFAASVLTPVMLGLPLLPFNVAEFCATEPTGDLPTTVDYIKQAFPPVALVTGSYARLGNQARYDKWASLCMCSAPSGPIGCFSPVYGGSLGSAQPNTDVGNLGHYFAVPRPLAFKGFVYYSAGSVFPAGDMVVNLYELISGVWTDVNSPRPTGITAVGTRYEIAKQYPTVEYILSPSKYYAVMLVMNDGWSWYNLASNALPTSGTLKVISWFGLQDSAANSWGSTTKNLPLYPWLCEPEPQPYEVDPPPPLEYPTGYPTVPDLDCSDGSSICNKIDALAAKLDIAMSLIQITQRQIVPFAYVPGAEYTGRTAQGSIGVSGILGLRVSITTLPPSLGYKGSTVPTIFDAGYITFGTPDGNLPSVPITHDNFVLLDVSPAVTWVYYDLSPGVVATLETLVREP